MYINDEIVGRSGGNSKSVDRYVRVKMYEGFPGVNICMSFVPDGPSKITAVLEPWQARDLAECLLLAADLDEPA